MSRYNFSNQFFNQFLDEKAFELFTAINQENVDLCLKKSRLINFYQDRNSDWNTGL